MPQLTPIQLNDGTIIYIEATENIAVSPTQQTNANPEPEEEQEVTRGGQKGWVKDQFDRTRETFPVDPRSVAVQSFKAIEGTIRAYTTYTLSAFQQVAVANIDKVKLEFGIEIGGEAGVPYVTKGTATSNMRITVECSFPKREL